MSSNSRLAKCFGDIVAAVDLIQLWTERKVAADILRDPLVRSAVERQLLVISEAAIRLHKLDPAAASRLAPDTDWPGIRGIGNFLRHSYDDLDTGIILDVLEKRLGPLKAACERAKEILAK
jgi:uncharacterized protein with HEPN domain